MTEAAIPSGSVFALEVREHHEFEPEDFSRGEPVSEQLPVRPFKKMERTSDYVFSLPEVHDPSETYPWDDRKWQGEWLWNEGGIGRAEAYFWFVALTHPERVTDTRTAFKAPRDLRRIRHVDADRFTVGEARERLTAWFEALQARPAPMKWFPHAYLTRFLRELLPAADVVDLLFEVLPAEQVRHFFAHLLQPEDPDELEALRDAVRRHLAPLDYSDIDQVYTGVRLLERVPIEDEAERLVAAVANDEALAPAVRDAVNLLQEPSNFARWFNALDAYHFAPEEIAYVVGKGGFEVVEALMERVVAAEASVQMKAIKELIRLHTSRAVPGFVALYDDSAVGPMAHGWLIEEGANAIAGLIPMATGRSRLTHVAQRLLREYRDRGHADLIERLSARETEAVRQRIVEDILSDGIGLREELPDTACPDWMSRRLSRNKPSRRLPDYIDVEHLPPLVTADGRYFIPQDIVFGIINRIISSRPDKVDELIPRLREFLSASSRHEFAWHIFERWRENGAEAREKFCIWALGLLGTDESGARLSTYLNEWASGGAFHRARWALDVYRLLGTDSALTTLHRISQKARSRALRECARENLDEIAAERGLSIEALEDLIVPTFGLDARGERELDLGERSLHVRLGDDLKPHLFNADGKELKKFPQLRKSDDASRVAAARDEWKLMRKQLAEAIKVQRARLEGAMISGRRWTPARFRALFLEHPLMTQLGQRVVWGEFERGATTPQRTFRVTAERELVDVEDDPVELDGSHQIRVVHPIQLDDAAREAWGQILADYEISPPFPQLDRAIAEIEDDDAREISRFSGVEVEAKRLRGRLEGRKWSIFGADNGYFTGFTRRFEAQGVTVLLTVDQAIPQSWTEMGDQMTRKIARVSFHAKAPDPAAETPAAGMRLGDVSDILFSEVCLDLQGLLDRSELS